MLVARKLYEHSNNSTTIRLEISRNTFKAATRKINESSAASTLNSKEALHSCGRLSNILSIGPCPHYEDTVLSYIAMSVMKAMSQIKAHFDGLKDQISIIDLFTTFKSETDSNQIRKGAATRTLPHYEQETLANALNSCMCAKSRLAPLATSVR